MAVTAAQLTVKVGGDTSGAEKSLDDVNKKVKDSDSFFKSTLSTILGFVGGEAVLAGVGGVVGVLTGFLGDCFDATKNEQQAQALLTNALKDSHGATGQNIQGLTDMAEHLSTVTEFSKDTVEGVEEI